VRSDKRRRARGLISNQDPRVDTTPSSGLLTSRREERAEAGDRRTVEVAVAEPPALLFVHPGELAIPSHCANVAHLAPDTSSFALDDSRCEAAGNGHVR